MKNTTSRYARMVVKSFLVVVEGQKDCPGSVSLRILQKARDWEKVVYYFPHWSGVWPIDLVGGLLILCDVDVCARGATLYVFQRRACCFC